jgi:hypothetical protein
LGFVCPEAIRLVEVGSMIPMIDDLFSLFSFDYSMYIVFSSLARNDT